MSQYRMADGSDDMKIMMMLTTKCGSMINAESSLFKRSQS
jgi:hypothetical protein